MFSFFPQFSNLSKEKVNCRSEFRQEVRFMAVVINSLNLPPLKASGEVD